MQKISESSIERNSGTRKPLDGPFDTGTGTTHEEKLPLSRLIDIINDRFGTDFNDSDQLFFEQIIEAAAKDESLKEAALVNPQDKFLLLFTNMLQTLFIERMEQNEEFFAKFMGEKNFKELVSELISEKVYTKLRKDMISESSDQ